MASPPAPQPAASWWLSLASRLGRVAVVCLIVENFLLLLAPLAFLIGMSPNVSMTSASLLLVFSDAGFLVSLADLFAVIGFPILAPVLFLILTALARSKRRVPYDTLLLGGALACVIAVIPVELYAHARAAGPSRASMPSPRRAGGPSPPASLSRRTAEPVRV